MDFGLLSDLPAQLVSAAIFYLVFLFSTTLHEAAHALAAKLGGDLTAYHGGQVAVSPLPHIRREPVGMVVLPILGLVLTGWPIGYASAPFDRGWAMAYPRRAGLMALAGPAANLALVLAAGAVIRLGVSQDLLFEPGRLRFDRIVAADPQDISPGITFMLSVLFTTNLVVAAFNLLPLPPLDGAAALGLILGRGLNERYQSLMLSPAVQLFGLLIAWRVFDAIFGPLFLAAVNLLYPGAGYR